MARRAPDARPAPSGERIWIVNQYADAPDHPAGTRHYDLARHLVARGHEVTIFATGFSNVTHRDERLARGAFYRTRTFSGVRFVWVRTFPYQASDWRRQANMLTFLVTFLVAQLRFPRPDAVIGSTVHPFGAFGAWLAARTRGARFFFEVRDLWPQTLVDLGALREGSPGERVLRSLEAFLVRRASAVITLLPGMRDYLLERGLPAEHVVYVPNGVDLAAFDRPDVPREALSPTAAGVLAAAGRLRAEGRLVVGYVGAFGRVNRLDTVLVAAAMAEQRAPGRVGLVIVGDGPERAELADVADGLAGAVVCGPVPKALVPMTLRAFDATVVHTTETPVYRYGISFNKLFDYMGAAKPVVFACTSAYDPVAHEGAGLSVAPDDPSGLADAFLRMADAGPARRAAMGAAGRAYVEREHSIERLGATLEAVLTGEPVQQIAPSVALDERAIGAPAPVAPSRGTLPRRALAFVAGNPMVRRAVVSTPVVRDVAWRFVAGETLADGVATLRALNARGLAGSLNHVGTHVRDAAEAVAAADAVIAALRAIRDGGLDASVSVKLTQIGLDVDDGLAREHLARVLEAARDADGFVRIDMEESRYVDPTLDIFEEARSAFGADRVGIVIQSYLRGRDSDLDRLMDGGSRIRLVKGGYWESPDVVHRQASEINAAFRRDIERLLRRGVEPAIATHDSNAVNHARRVAADLGLERTAYEFQMLYGVRSDLQDRLARDGHRVRCYVPYGGQWYEYVLGCVRRLPGGAVHRVRERVGGGRA